ncbi:MAG: sodium:solute symporter [Zetaproteobacteria bacterium CG_4_9_14_3_um_filter_49_83]|nr:MAG: sodium:solute symporter [Zetaproteobacteria bacterium CG1_02_49_23]PIQ32459.1 MAG: sodium:solute symporter [Zetaproteobacteria bacterium CG17_big_fil_post_rev_8_21_14_2_50_50_13]PIV31302.1 MAG: sodium:solute symporter [Zetaproteobacteria bacterium CG02_land_8_20_14_3_00_50_9]PIY55063.1 MAG: sodium:solute symporter [Zetaproteobacteria bacterium CG_4_10_14_0_8_um_filter_49_80]PJA35938.1 MAG: sodium:solute symporter [Zetaproteobacteria bacterium CG_4_9_14_3_um_filter_49_83]
MLVGFVIFYLVVSIALGVYAATRVHNARDYITADRKLPFFVVVSMVFATWFGAETVLGIPATFLEEDLAGLVSDPFGASLCLILFGLFFARKLYRLNLLTIVDFYRQRFDRRVEFVTGIAITLSYLGWVSAQITALGLVFNVLSDGSITQVQGIIIGASVVLMYTLFGGMWAVAVTTSFQMVVIVIGLFYVAWLVADLAGGVAPVVEHAVQNNKFNFWPDLNAVAMIAFISGLLTMGFGSIPQQDVFQRANSANSENAAVWGTVVGGVAYFLFAAVPIYLAYSAHLMDPMLVATLLNEDAQKILPSLVLGHLPLLAQVVFFGALLAVIMSTASGTLLAPSVTLSENVLKGWLLRDDTSEAHLLLMTRWVVATFALLVTLYALWALDSDLGIHQMVENAYKVTLVVAFVPLVAGLYWKRATTLGAYCAIIFGLLTWLPMEFIAPEGEGLMPPQFAGFLMAIVGMVLGSLLRRQSS